ncbi:MAG: efflux RND transporter permease subunit [Bacteroidetes bacterium]|nr:efflux RND transporter permease subunit [Bacteroidota bacterium]
MSITELAVKRPSLIVVIFSVLAFLGVLSYSKLSYELMPKMSMPVITVMTVYPGAAPSEVENSVTKKIEDAIASLENLDDIKSVSQEGLSMVVLQLKQNSNTDLILQDAQRKINAITSQLPDDVLSPVIQKISFDEMPILSIGVSAKVPPRQLYDIVKNIVVPSLGKVTGAAKVSTTGGEQREIKINVNREKADLYKISLLQINQAIAVSNLDFPTGKIKNNERQILIRLAGKYQSITELENIVVGTDKKTNSLIRLKEIASVEDGTKEIKSFGRIDGRGALMLSIQKQTDANTVDLAQKEREQMKELEGMYAKEGLKFYVAQDSSTFIMKAADGALVDLGLAVIIVAACMLLFLHSVRNSLIVMIAIPASLVSVFIAINLLGYSLNLMTLLAMSLVVGILVDDSIVVLENIYRHLEKGEQPRIAAIKGRSEIGFTALAITLVDVVVFLPLTFVGGIISNLLSQFSVVIVLATLMSLFVSFTLTPLLASRMAKVEKLNPKKYFGRFLLWFERGVHAFTESFSVMLKWALRHKKITIITTIVLLIGSFMLVGKGFIGKEFVSRGDRGEFIIQLELPKEATLQQTNQVAQKVEEYLHKNPEVIGVYSSIGTLSGQMTGSQSLTNAAEINVKLIPKEERKMTTDIYSAVTKTKLQEMLPGVKVSSSEVSIMGTANQAAIQVLVAGNNLDSLFGYANLLVDKLKQIKGTSEVKLSIEVGNPEITVIVDRDKMANLGLSLDVVGMSMQTAFNGNTNNQYTENGKEYDINIMYDMFDRKNIADLSSMTFINNRGDAIQLGQFANIVQKTGTSKLERKNRVSSVTVQSQVIGRSSGDVSDELESYFTKTKKPPVGITVAFDGNVKNMKEAGGNLGFALLASILFVYLIMVALYDSYKYPLVVLFSIPLAIVGALLALALSGQPLSIFAVLGMIMLIGLVAKNAILLVDFTNQMKKEGRNTVEALILAGKISMRPILMTTLSMIVGMMPIALSSGAGAEWKSGLAWVLIGGLTSSMLLTLIVVPCVYLIFDIFGRQISNKDAKRIVKEYQEPENMTELMEAL